MSVPAQPSFVWQMFHYDLEPNASLFALQKACEQIHIQFNETDNGIIQVINHEPKALSRAYAKITIYNIDGSVAAEKSHEVNLNSETLTESRSQTIFTGGGSLRNQTISRLLNRCLW